MTGVKEILEKHNKYFDNVLSFVPSENTGFIFDSISKKDISNRYFFKNDLFKTSFLGKKYIDEIYNYVESKLLSLLKIKYINLSPLSGITQMSLVIKSFVKQKGNIVMGVPVSKGGHYSTKRVVESLGYNFIEIPFIGNNINSELLIKTINNNSVDLIYIDQMTGVIPFEIDFSLKSIINREIVFYNDISHNLAFIISGQHKNQIEEGYDAFGGSFHKSFPGPQKAFVGTNSVDLAKKLDYNSEILFSSINFGSIYDVGLVLDYMDGKWEEYTKNIVLNVNIFGRLLEKIGFDIIGGKGKYLSKNHQLLFLLPNNFDPDLFSSKLEEVGILVNCIFLPFTDGKKGIRMGFQEQTLLGITKEQLLELCKIFSKILSGTYSIPDEKERVIKLKNILLKKINEKD